MTLFTKPNNLKKWSRKEKLFLFGVTLFCSALIVNTYLTNRISFDNLVQETIVIKNIDKSYGKVKNQFSWVLINNNNEKFIIPADFNDCLDSSLFSDNLKGKRITISTYNDFLRDIFTKTKSICFLKFEGKTYLETPCMKKASKDNFVLSIIFGLVMISIFISGIHIDRTRNKT